MVRRFSAADADSSATPQVRACCGPKAAEIDDDTLRLFAAVGRHDELAAAVTERFGGAADRVYSSLSMDMRPEIPPDLIQDIRRLRGLRHRLVTFTNAGRRRARHPRSSLVASPAAGLRGRRDDRSPRRPVRRSRAKGISGDESVARAPESPFEILVEDPSGLGQCRIAPPSETDIHRRHMIGDRTHLDMLPLE